MSIVMPLKDTTAAQLFTNNLNKKEGKYIFGSNRHWHGGMHFSINKPVQAVADGKLIAFRMTEDYLEHTYRKNGKELKNNYSNSFALIEHNFESPKGAKLKYYSLYMHLLPGNPLKTDSSKTVPAHLRAGKGDEVEATVLTDEDPAVGLNLRSPKNYKKENHAPFGSEVKILENPKDWETSEKYSSFKTNHSKNSNWKIVEFEKKTYMALLGEKEAEISGTSAKIICYGDEWKGKFGLRARKGGSGGEVIRVAKKGSNIKIKLPESGSWAEVTEIDSEKVPEGIKTYLSKKSLKVDLNQLDCDLANGEVQSVELDISAGDLIGYPGTNLAEKNCLHFEIFTDNSIEEFIKNPKDEGEKNILKVPSGTKLHKRQKNNPPLLKEEVKAYTQIEVIDDKTANSYAKFKTLSIAGIVNFSHLDWDGTLKKYKVLPDHVNNEKYKGIWGELLDANTQFTYIQKCTANGTKNNEGDFRFIELKLPVSKQKEYWTKMGQLKTKDLNGKGDFTSEDLCHLYEENPETYSFTSNSIPSTDDAYLDMTKGSISYDCDGNQWIEAELPFDSKGEFNILAGGYNIPRPQLKKEWILLNKCEQISPFDWPGFRIAKEEGAGNKDAYLDFDNMNPFFKQILETIDTNNDEVVSHEELSSALKNSILKERLGRTIIKHPSEWQADSDLSKWTHLEKWHKTKEEIDSTKEHIKKLVWWDDAKNLKLDPCIYNFSPISFLSHFSLIEVEDDWSGDSKKWPQDKKIRSLNPSLRPKIKNVIKELKSKGFEPFIFYGWRSQEVQLDLYKKGNSKVKFSFHNVTTKSGRADARAVDIVDKRYYWSETKETEKFWQALGESARKNGLYWGGDWTNFKDWAHVQLHPNSKLKELKNDK